MINKPKLLSALALINKSKAEYAAFLGISRSALSRKINGKSCFTLDEIQKSGQDSCFGKEICRDIFLL